MPVEPQTDGYEFSIGKKIYMLQRNAFDGSWDVYLPVHGWQSTGYSEMFFADEVEAAVRLNLKRGAKSFLKRRFG